MSKTNQPSRSQQRHEAVQRGFDPDRPIPVVKIMPTGIGSGPLVMRRDEPNSWNAIAEELKMLVENSEDGEGITVCPDKMPLGDYLMLGEHQGW